MDVDMRDIEGTEALDLPFARRLWVERVLEGRRQK
jgi:hypothetical protein